MSPSPAVGADRRIAGAGAESPGPVRAATPADLPRLNAVIACAIETWRVADRVKRVSLPLCQYSAYDLAYFQVLVGENDHGEIVAVAALEPGAATATSPDLPGMTLHGLYVDPAYQRSGVGSRMLRRVEALVAERGCRGLLVRAQASAAAFFAARGFERLPVRDAARDYPHRYWKPV